MTQLKFAVVTIYIQHLVHKNEYLNLMCSVRWDTVFEKIKLL